jgi:hypothetical protein
VLFRAQEDLQNKVALGRALQTGLLHMLLEYFFLFNEVLIHPLALLSFSNAHILTPAEALCEDLAGSGAACYLQTKAGVAELVDAADLCSLSTQSEISGVNGVKFGETFYMATPS